MKACIKQRIELLKNGEIPSGYSRTAFGVFPCDWITDKRLGDIGTFDKGKGIPGDKLVSAGVPCVGYGDIYMKYNHCFNKAQSFVDEETAKESLPIGKGTLLFTCTGETADEIGKCVCYNGEETIYAGGDILTFSSKEVSTMFLAYQQHLPFAIVQKARLGQGHSVVHIHKENLESLNVAFPSSTKEQETITEILMKQEHVIDLYKQKAEQLKRLKKIALQKMFPKHGSNVPEWRFPGFINPWEQRKFNELAETRRGLTYKPTDIRQDGVRVLRSSNIDEDTFVKGEDDVFVDRSAINIPFACTGDILITSANGSSRLVGKHAIIRGIPDNSTVHGGFMLLASAKNPQFVNALMGSTWYTKFINLFVAGGNGAIGNLNKNDLDEQFVLVPSEPEQEMIGQFFENIDDLITLHQRLQEEEKKKLKSLMRLLLTGIVRV